LKKTDLIILFNYGDLPNPLPKRSRKRIFLSSGVGVKRSIRQREENPRQRIAKFLKLRERFLPDAKTHGKAAAFSEGTIKTVATGIKRQA